MKIMHVIKHSWRSNGHVHVAVDLACAQADAGHEVTFAHAHGSYDDLLRAHGVTIATVPEASTLLDVLRSERALLGVARAARPEVVHAHMMSSAVLAHPVSKVVRAPLVTTMHNSFDSHSWLMRLGTVVVAVSEAERQRLIGRGFPARKVVCVLNGAVASPREALPDDLSIGSLAGPCVVSLCGLHGRKAVGDIITAFSKAQPAAPAWQLNIIGSGPDRDRLEGLARDLGLSASVHFTGPSLTPWRLLEQADVFASASLDEPFGLSLAEARAAGCAVVATAVGGVPEVLEQGRAGQLVPVSAPEAMADVLRRLMTDRDELARWRARARENADYFSVRRMAEDYDRVYQSVVG
ncbi:glycosyltransferase family 4 protein [Modestobacter excelsi]|uniref:glycosyltransferase family 4 protein n=1 Tax=Modestobacter excelsi TaxID=2213161 RepID=UPI00319E2C29